MNLPLYKVVVLGQGEVGKTSISVKYVKDQFSQETKRTVNASYLEKKVQLENQQTVKLSIWDTAGQQEYNSVAPIYYRDAVAALIVYDITSRESFAKAKKWVTELQQNAPKGIVLTIVGNKADLENSRLIQKQQVEKYAKSCSAGHFTVSAKNGLRINEMFQNIAQRIHASSSAQNKISNKRGKGLIIENNKETNKTKEKKKEGCC